jgi:hypothetical protein
MSLRFRTFRRILLGTSSVNKLFAWHLIVLSFRRFDYRSVTCLDYFIYFSLAFKFFQSLEVVLDDNFGSIRLHDKVLVVVRKILDQILHQSDLSNICSALSKPLLKRAQSVAMETVGLFVLLPFELS